MTKRLTALTLALGLLLAGACGSDNVREEMSGEDPSDYRGISGGDQDTTPGIGTSPGVEQQDTLQLVPPPQNGNPR